MGILMDFALSIIIGELLKAIFGEKIDATSTKWEWSERINT